MEFRRGRKPEVTINIAPLVDVVFLLVIFFAVSTTFLESAGLQLELPESSSTAERDARSLTVFLAADGEISFAGETVSADDLAERLGASLAESEEKIVVLRADTRTEHGRVVRLMDLIRAAGAEALTVAARAEPVE